METSSFEYMHPLNVSFCVRVWVTEWHEGLCCVITANAVTQGGEGMLATGWLSHRERSLGRWHGPDSVSLLGNVRGTWHSRRGQTLGVDYPLWKKSRSTLRGAKKAIQIQNNCSRAGGDSAPCFMAFQETGKKSLLMHYLFSSICEYPVCKFLCDKKAVIHFLGTNISPELFSSLCAFTLMIL